MNIASHLHMSVARAQSEINSTEFVDWIVYLKKQWNRQDVMFHYLAQIAAEIRRGNAKYPNSVKTENFLLKFVEKMQEEAEEEGFILDGDFEDDGYIHQDVLDKRIQNSKNFWFGLLGYNPKKPKEPKKLEDKSEKKEKQDVRTRTRKPRGKTTP